MGRRKWRFVRNCRCDSLEEWLRLKLSPSNERHLLQTVIAVAGFVPVCTGLAGAILGASLTRELTYGASIDSQVRFLSGMLLGIGLAFWEAIPQIEHHTERVRALTMIVILGGVVRLISIAIVGTPGWPMLFGLLVELGVTPAICLWQTRIARLSARRGGN